MKCIIRAMVVGALFTGTSALAGDAPIVVPSSAFPGSSPEMIVLPSRATYADQHAAGEIAQGGWVSTFPGSSPEIIVLPSRATYADRHAAAIAQGGWVSAFPGSSPEIIVLPPRTADRFVYERNIQARGTSDPVLMQ